MSEFSSHTNPQILVNGEQREQQEADSGAGEHISSSNSLEEECSEDRADADKEKQAKMQSVLQQVRDQIRSQVGVKAHKSSILELVQRLRDREKETAEMSETEETDVSSEDKKQETLTDKSKYEMDLKEVELCAVFEEKLEAREKVIREEFEGQISQVRKEMQVYTNQALKDLECKLQNQKPQNPLQRYPKDQPESRGSEKKQKPPAAASLASRRGRVLTRTMTTIIPKTSAPIIVGPRAKSETLNSSKGESSRFLPRDQTLSHAGCRLGQSCRPLPPACPPLHQRKKQLQAKTKPTK